MKGSIEDIQFTPSVSHLPCMTVHLSVIFVFSPESSTDSVPSFHLVHHFILAHCMAAFFTVACCAKGTLVDHAAADSRLAGR